eukprot:g7971.t1
MWLERCRRATDDELRRLAADGANAEKCERFLETCTTMARGGILNFLGIGQAQAQQQLAVRRAFAAAQLERQSAGLTSNTTRGGTAHADAVVTQYRRALELAVRAEPDDGAGGGGSDAAASASRSASASASAPASAVQPMSAAFVLRLHREACGGGLLRSAGSLRTIGVRAGAQRFCEPAAVPARFDEYTRAVAELDGRRRSTGACAFAAAAMHGLMELHPFEDGNGRLARIVANWALARCGCPFVVNFAATPQQRADYITAVRACHRDAAARPDGNPLAPLTRLVAERLAHAVEEYQRQVQATAASATHEAEQRAARAARERAAAGACIICLGEAPNIMTVCCGSAVHLNCLAEWLSSHETCVHCRGALPRLPPRPAAPNQQAPVAGAAMAGSSGSDNDDGDTTATTELDTTEVDAAGAGAVALPSPEQTERQRHVAVLEAAIEAQQRADNPNQGLLAVMRATLLVVQAQAAQQQAEEEDTTTTTDETTEDADEATADADETTSDETTDTDTTSTTRARPGRDPDAGRTCLTAGCRNRKAADCSNLRCGQCCVLHGQFQCARHNNT